MRTFSTRVLIPLMLIFVLLLPACGSRFPENGFINVTSTDYTGFVNWQTKSEDRLGGGLVIMCTVYINISAWQRDSSTTGKCNRKSVLTALGEIRHDFLNAPAGLTKEALWVEEAIKTVESLEGAKLEEAAGSTFPKSGYIDVEYAERKGRVVWESIPDCKITTEVNQEQLYQEQLGEPCSQEKVIESLSKFRDEQPELTLETAHSAWKVDWTIRAIDKLSDMTEPDLIASSQPTPIPKPIFNELAVIWEAKSDRLIYGTDGLHESFYASGIFTRLVDSWRERKLEICNLPDPYQGTGIYYPEAVLVVADRETYEPNLPPFVPIVDLDEFKWDEYPVIFEAKVDVTVVQGPYYTPANQPGLKVPSSGLKISGHIKISGTDLRPAVFAGLREPIFPTSLECPTECGGGNFVGGDGIDELFDPLLDKGLKVEIDNAIRKTVVCQ